MIKRLVDARGMLCPWPVIRVGRAAREMGGEGVIRVLADDPNASRELEQLSGERGWRFTKDEKDACAYEITLG